MEAATENVWMKADDGLALVLVWNLICDIDCLGTELIIRWVRKQVM
jgi:hypothetical protein